MAAYSFFTEDEVCIQKPGKGYCFGLILENSEFLSSSDDDENEKSEDRLQAGTVKVAWHPIGKETVIAENKLQLVDRSLMPGDVVRRLIPGQESQCGFVINMDVRSHLRVLRTNKYIYNVDSKDLQPIEKFETGQEVMLDSWLGKIENVVIDAVLLFPDGARCQIDQNELYSLDEKVERHGKFSECLYYPGQELKGPLASLAEAKWLHSTVRHSHKAATKKGKSPTVHLTIEKIITKQVEVFWVFRGYEKVDTPDIAVSPPSRIVEGSDVDRLKVLDWFSHCSIQIGDRMIYHVKNDDILSTIPPSKAYDAKTALEKECPVNIDKDGEHRNNTDTVSTSFSNQSAVNGACEDDDDADYVDVGDDAEEDSDAEEKLGACGGHNPGSRAGSGNKKKHFMYKGGGAGTQKHKLGQHQKAAGRRTCPKERLVKADDIVEVEVEFNTSWAVIMWQDGTVERDVPSVDLFPVHHLDELEFFPGDYILPSVDLPQQVDYGVLVKADHRERTCLIHWFKAYDVGKDSEPTVVERNAAMSVYDIKDHPDYKFRPGQSVVRVGGFENLPTESGPASQAVGQVFELDPNGHLVIKWADGSISQCFPQEVFIVSDEADDSDIGSWETESDYDSDASGDTWETESESEVIGEDGAKGDAGDWDSSQQQGEAASEHKQELNTLLGRAEAALARLQKLLNNFDVTVSAPDCFIDIIRIYRSCHDLDKILQSSFFNDPELQALITQAKLELSRDRVNRISRNLTQVFEHWSRNIPSDAADVVAREGSNVGTVSVGGKTIKIGTVRNGKIVDVNVLVPVERGDCSTRQNHPKASDGENNSGAEGGNGLPEGGDQQEVSPEEISECVSSVNSLSCSNCADVNVLKKESSEPSISKLGGSCQNGERRPSDPLKDYSAALTHRGNEANLVGENCVSKAPKRTKSDGYDDSGREVKKSRDDGKTSNLIAQELCFKICQNLQKQVVKIQEEVNKRVGRLLSASDAPSEKSQETLMTGKHEDDNDKDTLNAVESDALVTKTSHMQEQRENNPASVEESKTQSCAHEDSQLKKPSPERAVEHRETVDSLPHSMDEGGERASLLAERLADTQACDEKGDVPKQNAAVKIDPGNEASCEESSSLASLASEDIHTHLAPHSGNLGEENKGFEIYGEAVSFHKYFSQESQPAKPAVFKSCIRKELKLFQSSLPDGIFVKGFENRLDLYSVMILGPQGTPYEDALFLFDIMMPNDYPTSPPLLHYYSFCSDRLNPNLYEDGKVCVSLLGTWSGKGSEVWTSKSNMLQVLLSIQGLILVSEPYYNEAYYERQRGTQVGYENSRMYNEMAILKTVQSLTRLCQRLPELFKHEIYKYLRSHGPRMIKRLRQWMDMSESQKKNGQVANCSDVPSCESGQRDVTAESSELHHHHKAPAPVTVEDCGKPGTGQTEPVQSDITPNKGDLPKGEEPVAYVEDGESSSSDPQPFSSSVDLEPTKVPQGAERKAISKKSCGAKAQKSVPVADIVSSQPSASSDGLGDAGIGTSVDVAPACLSVPSPSPAEKEGLDLTHPDAHSLKEPEFPLFPMSRGFCLTLEKHLHLYEQALQGMGDPAMASALPNTDLVLEKETPVCNDDSSKEDPALLELPF